MDYSITSPTLMTSDFKMDFFGPVEVQEITFLIVRSILTNNWDESPKKSAWTLESGRPGCAGFPGCVTLSKALFFSPRLRCTGS